MRAYLFILVAVLGALLVASSAKIENQRRNFEASPKVAVAMIMGLGGKMTSEGVVAMCDAVNKKAPGTFQCNLYGWDDWKTAASWLQNQTKTRVILGYSNGGSVTTWILQLGFFVDLAIALDPTIWLEVVPLGNNVKDAVCFHDSNPINPVGHAYLKKGSTWNDKNQTLTTIDTMDLHLSVDTDPKIQKYCYDKIYALGS